MFSKNDLLQAATNKVLQCVAVCCNVMQYVAVCCSVLQFVAVCYKRPTVGHNKQRLIFNDITCI